MSDTKQPTYVCCHCHRLFTIGLIVAWEERLYCVWHAPKEAQERNARALFTPIKDDPFSLF